MSTRTPTNFTGNLYFSESIILYDLDLVNSLPAGLFFIIRPIFALFLISIALKSKESVFLSRVIESML